MKILFVVVGYFSPVSGVGKTCSSLAYYLARENEVMVFASRLDKGTSSKIAFRKVSFWNPGRRWAFIFPLPTLWNFILGSYLCFISRKRFDIIHVFNGLVWSKSAFITLQMCQKGAIKFSAGRSRIDRWKKISPKHLLILGLECLIYHRELFRKLIVCSEFEKQEIVHFYRTNPSRIDVLYNGIDEIGIPTEEARKNARVALGYSEDKNVCLFVGYDLKRKGLIFAIRALMLLPPEYRLLIVGGEDSTGYYAGILTEAGLLNRVRFVGPHRDISQFYNAADIFVFPTLYEPFGTVVVEAMGRGLPVVVSKRAGAAELITPGKEGYLIENPEDHEEIANLIGKIRQQGIACFSGAALKTAGKATWESRAAELMAIYRDRGATTRNDINYL